MNLLRARPSETYWVTATAVALFSAIAWWASPGSFPTDSPESSKTELATNGMDREVVFREHVLPILEAEHEIDRKTVDQCILRIRDSFRGYRKGIQPFAEDLTSTSTRLGVLGRMPSDWWSKDGRVELFVRKKFEEHLFSEEKLTNDFATAFTQLRDDLKANRYSMLSKVKVAISESEMPQLVLPDQVEFEVNVQEQFQKFVTNRSTDSVYLGIASFLMSDIATTVVASVVTRVVTSIGASVATSSAAAGGATAGSAAAGAGGGSLAGPAGTAIGLGVGLVAGVAIDWWMTDRFRSQLERELESYLFRLEHGILFGENGRDGLEKDLQALLKELSNAQNEVLRKKLIGVNPP